MSRIGLLIIGTISVSLILWLLHTNVSKAEKNPGTIVLLHVLFLHGDREPELSKIYPNDPNAKQLLATSAFNGHLTKAGKRRAFSVGKTLRQRYGDFLGLYTPNAVTSRSSDFDRTKMSCLLVLAGLFPPLEDQKFEDSLNWQPIPYSYTSREDDKILGNPQAFCQAYRNIYRQYTMSTNGQRFYKDNKELYDYLSINTGWEIKTSYDIYKLYFSLQCEEAMGLELSEWTNGVWPDNISLAGAEEYFVQTAPLNMTRLAAGHLLSKILNDTYQQIDGRQPPQRKLFLYAGHDFNLAFLLRSLDLLYHHFPSFGSYITLEVHKVNNDYSIRILYENYEAEQPRLLILKNCTEFCPLAKFQEHVQQYLALPNECNE